MAPLDTRRPYKRAAISDQQKRRELALLRQAQQRRDAQHHARKLASSVVSLQAQGHEADAAKPEEEPEKEVEEAAPRDLNVVQASKQLRGSAARRWFARQLMLPEWMVDVPPRLDSDWFVCFFHSFTSIPLIAAVLVVAVIVNLDALHGLCPMFVAYLFVFPRPAGSRCFVVSVNGTTVSRLRNGSVLHHFPSALPNGARTKDLLGPAHMFCILDCIFHEPDQTYYVIDMVCWRGYSLYDCSAEFRFFWLNSKLAETGACNPPSLYHKYRFSVVPIYNCDQTGLQTAYAGVVVLELQDDGKVSTSDDPPVVFGCLDGEIMQKSGALLRFVIGEQGLRIADGKLEMADLCYVGKANRARAFADSYSKILFQYTARHSPLKVEDLVASICWSQSHSSETMDVETA
ncbi:hypothetical protein ACLOJK_001491 [Asimina triloba]